jgi:hypothetical protein
MRLSERQQLGVSLTPANLTYTGPQTVFQYTIIGQQLCLATSASQEYITLKAGTTRFTYFFNNKEDNRKKFRSHCVSDHGTFRPLQHFLFIKKRFFFHKN